MCLDNLINIRNLCIAFVIIKGRFSIFDTFLFPYKNKSSIFATKLPETAIGMGTGNDYG